MGLLGARAALLVQFTGGVFHKSLQAVDAGALCAAALGFVSRKCPWFREALNRSRGCRQAAGPRADGLPAAAQPRLPQRDADGALPCCGTEKTLSLNTEFRSKRSGREVCLALACCVEVGF